MTGKTVRGMLLLGAALWGVSGAGVGAEPRKTGEIYETEVHVLVPDSNGRAVERPVRAELQIRGGELADSGTTPIITVEVELAEPAMLVRVPRSSLPGEFAEFLGSQGDRIFMQAHTSEMKGKLQLDLAGPVSTDRDSGRYDHAVTLRDALGRPAEGALVEVSVQLNQPRSGGRLRQVITRQTLGPDGRLAVSLPRPPRLPGQLGATPGVDTLVMHEMTVTDPSTGQKQIVSHPFRFLDDRSGAGKGDQPVVLDLALVLRPATPSSTTPVFAGQVVDEEGKPAEDALLTLPWQKTAPRQPGVYSNEMAEVRTGREGRFSVSATRHTMEATTGEQFWPLTQPLRAALGAPGQRLRPGSGAAAIQADLQIGTTNVVTLAPMESLTIQLLDENGDVIRDRNRLTGGIALTRQDPVTSPRTPQHVAPEILSFDEATGTIHTGPVPVPAVYTLELQEQPPLRFSAQRVERGGGDKLITWQPDTSRASVTGRVVSAVTGHPVQNAYVMSVFIADAGYKFAAISPEARDAVWQNWEMKDPERRLTVMLPDDRGSNRYSPEAIARTDADGRYRLVAPAGAEIQAVTIWAPGYLPVSGTLGSWRHSNEEDSTQDGSRLPDTVMTPSAEAVVTVGAPDRLPDPRLRQDAGRSPESVALHTKVIFKASPSWAIPSKSEAPRRTRELWEPQHGASWFQPGDQFRVFVPAGVSFDLRVEGLNEVTGAVEWKNVGPLLAGSVRELEPKPLPVKVPFLILVRQADGTPVPGVGVRLDGQLPVVTGPQGTAVAWSASGQHERVEVWSIPEDFSAPPLLRLRNVKIPEGEEPLILTLPQESTP